MAFIFHYDLRDNLECIGVQVSKAKFQKYASSEEKHGALEPIIGGHLIFYRDIVTRKYRASHIGNRILGQDESLKELMLIEESRIGELKYFQRACRGIFGKGFSKPG